jgi:hypothetical protein
MAAAAWLIDWENPEENHFAIAEEVTVEGHHNLALPHGFRCRKARSSFRKGF